MDDLYGGPVTVALVFNCRFALALRDGLRHEEGVFFKPFRHDFAALDSLHSFRAKRSSHALLRVVRRHGMVVQAGRTAAVFIFTFANDATHGAPTVLMTTEFMRTENVGHAPLLGE